MPWAIIAHTMGGSQYVPRFAARLLRKALDVSPVVVVMGARQTGKSTLVQSEPSLGNHVYLTLDDPDVRERARLAPDELLGSLPRATLDEVQREPDLLLAVKRAVDNDKPRRNGRFVLTGSANLLLMQRVSESLAGRATYVNLWPFTRQERQGKATAGIWSDLLSTPAADWPSVMEAQDDAPVDWRAAVCESGYPVPAFELIDPDARSLWFDGYVRTYLERDLQMLSAVGDLVDFRRLMRAASHRLGGLVNQSEIARDTSIPRATVQRYLNLLETSFQSIRLPAYSVNRTKRLIKGPKLYWSDPALAIWLTGSSELTGAHLENLVLTDLIAWRDGQVPSPEVLYWRTTTDREVDFVIEAGERLLAIEVKTAAARYADTTGLRLFRAEYADRFVGGLLLHGGDEIHQFGDGILAVPWWRVL